MQFHCEEKMWSVEIWRFSLDDDDDGDDGGDDDDDDDDDDDAPPEVGIGSHTQHALQGSALGVAPEALCR